MTFPGWDLVFLTRFDHHFYGQVRVIFDNFDIQFLISVSNNSMVDIQNANNEMK